VGKRTDWREMMTGNTSKEEQNEIYKRLEDGARNGKKEIRVSILCITLDPRCSPEMGEADGPEAVLCDSMCYYEPDRPQKCQGTDHR
jgi:hypothetical protein